MDKIVTMAERYFTIHSIDLCNTELVQKVNTGTCYVHSISSNHSIPVELETDIKNAIEKIVNDHHCSLPRPAAAP